jgi:thiol-disulfide isomerase/thioredoxin
MSEATTKTMRRLLLPILLILASSVGLAQSPAKTQSTQPVPQIAGNARFRSLDSQTSINMADYLGRVVVLALWATWCAPCREAVERLAELHQEFADRGVEVIALSVENPQLAETDVRRFLADTHIAYKVGWISKISADKLMVGRDAIPQIFIIKDAVILKRFVGWNPKDTVTQLREALEQDLTRKSN